MPENSPYVQKTHPYKNRVFDKDGNRKIAKGYNFYIAETPTGDTLKIYTDGKRHTKAMTNMQPNSLANLVKGSGGSQAFKENTQNGTYAKNARYGKEKAARQVQLAAAGELWRYNQRECLKVMMTMPVRTIYGYLIKWGQMTQSQVLASYDVNITDDELMLLDSQKPTMLQVISLTMILKAQADGKFGMTIMEMLEGKAVGIDKVAQSKAKVEEEPVREEPQVDPETNDLLERIKNRVYEDDES